MRIIDLRGYDLLHHGSLLLGRMEMNGIHIDVERGKRELAAMQEEMDECINIIMKHPDVKEWQHKRRKHFNPNSSDQVGDLFFRFLDFEMTKQTETGKPSADADSLLQTHHPIAKLILKLRQLKQAQDDIKDILSQTVGGYVHPSFHLHNVSTFRSSSSNPNMQNIPVRDSEMARVRHIIIPRPGNQLLEFDFKGIEVAVAACYTGDQNLIRYVTDPKTDMHRDVASQIFMIPPDDVPKPLRSMVKGGFTFAQFYGSWWKPCAEYMWKDIHENGYSISGIPLLSHLKQNGIGDFESFAEHVRSVEADFWGNRFCEYARWKERIYAEYVKNGYIDTFTGFRLQGYMRKNAVTNYPIQGSAFHILLWTLIHLQKAFDELKMKSKIIAEIHDSGLIDVFPGELERVVYIIQKLGTEYVRKVWKWIIVPLRIEFEVTEPNRPWSEKKPHR